MIFPDEYVAVAWDAWLEGREDITLLAALLLDDGTYMQEESPGSWSVSGAPRWGSISRSWSGSWTNNGDSGHSSVSWSGSGPTMSMLWYSKSLSKDISASCSEFYVG